MAVAAWVEVIGRFWEPVLGSKLRHWKGSPMWISCSCNANEEHLKFPFPLRLHSSSRREDELGHVPYLFTGRFPDVHSSRLAG